MNYTFTDAEALTVAYLSSFAGVTVGVELPNDLTGLLPFVMVTRIPSGGDDYITDTATIDLDIFHSTRAQAVACAQLVHGYMHRLRHTSVGGSLVDSVETMMSPGYLNYGDENLARYVASYQIATRAVG